MGKITSLTAVGQETDPYIVFNVRIKEPGTCLISVTGSFNGSVGLYHQVNKDDYWFLTKTYTEETRDIALVASHKESFKFVAESDFSGQADVVVTQGDVTNE